MWPPKVGPHNSDYCYVYLIQKYAILTHECYRDIVPRGYVSGTG